MVCNNVPDCISLICSVLSRHQIDFKLLCVWSVPQWLDASLCATKLDCITVGRVGDVIHDPAGLSIPGTGLKLVQQKNIGGYANGLWLVDNWARFLCG